MKKIVILLSLLFTIFFVYADNPFVVVMYDSSSERSIEKFPPNRTQFVYAINALKKMNAKAVVLKFFFDLPKNTNDDQKLANSLKELPVFIQARIDNTEKNPNAFNNKYFIKMDSEYQNSISGNSGWIPLPNISSNAYDLGFVDIRKPEFIPIIEKYQGKYVKSLWYCILKYVLPELRIEKEYLINNDKKVKINEYGEIEVHYPIKNELNYIPFQDLINSKIDKNTVENKIVIIGYDGESIDKIKVSTGELKAHRVFIYSLYDMYDQLK